MKREYPKPKGLVVAGIMSGTSADGMDVALCRITPSRLGSTAEPPKLKLLAHRSFPYTTKVRAAVLAAMDAKDISVAELSQLNWRLGALYAEAVRKTLEATKMRADLVAMHGQTLYHQPTATTFLGAATRSTWQLGEASVLAEALGVPVISDFRPADLAAGGQGAPLVPMLDYALFRHATRNRILLNLGGIANLTAIPAGGDIDSVLAFDTGPANMIVDALMQHFTGKAFDRNGALAAKGSVVDSALEPLLALPYFSADPPKSCGREQFGKAFVEKFLKTPRLADSNAADAVATATAFTSRTVLDAYARFVWPHLGQRAPQALATELLVAGGGAHNRTLMRQLSEGFAQSGVKVTTTEALGLPIEAKEAAAFALLGWLTWHGLPANVPSATGAKRSAILGKVSYAG
ncbi:MAG: anhydro-N-acetylmuramic acid kinase [Acidobacteriaceae bacterium]|nr:anhydro-N-acetylmuramic acid kinase [Acidobacteriaceae bacterium]